MSRNYPTVPPATPDPFDVARADRSAEFGWWWTNCDGGADTAFARAHGTAKPAEVEWSTPRQVAS